MGTRGEWATDFAAALGNTQPSAKMVNWISAWTKGENTEAKFNPLATMLDYGKNTCFNDVCVRNYETRDQGIQAAAQTLQGNYPGYQDIREGIKLDDVNRAANGLIRAPWGTNGALVQNTAALYDVRNEPLKSEGSTITKIDETIVHGGTKTENDPLLGIVPVSSVTIEDRRASEESRIASTGEYTDQYTRYGYGILGAFFVGIAGFLIIRNYVPTQQVVKTIKAVA